jgi:hypothetical protein
LLRVRGGTNPEDDKKSFANRGSARQRERRFQRTNNRFQQIASEGIMQGERAMTVAFGAVRASLIRVHDKSFPNGAAAVLAVMLAVGPLAFGVATAQAPASAPKAAPAKSTAAAPTKAANGSDPIQIKLDRKKVTRTAAGETLIAATSVLPGETLEEMAVYTNRSQGAVSKLEATLPVPANTELVMSSVSPVNAKASLDGTNFSNMPLKRLVTRPNGVAVEEVVPLREYRFLRWYPGELGAGQSLTVKARFKVIDDASAPAPVAAKAANAPRAATKAQ